MGFGLPVTDSKLHYICRKLYFIPKKSLCVLTKKYKRKCRDEKRRDYVFHREKK